MNRRNAILGIVICGLLFPLIVLAQNSAPKLGVLSAHDLQALQDSTTQLDLLWLHADPTLLENPANLKQFAILNNCSSDYRDWVKFRMSLDNEFDYRSIAFYYKSKGQEILADIPTKFTATLQNFLWANGGTVDFVLGEYNMERKVFPFVNIRGGQLTAPVTLRNFTAPGVRGPCGGKLENAEYRVAFDDFKFTELRMDEDAARSFVASLRPSLPRIVFVQLELELLPSAPQVSKVQTPAPRNPYYGRTGTETTSEVVTFRAKLTKATVVTPQGRPLGVLYP
ncbi:MAG: hypothetical protein ACRD2O_04065 [Terriglobia bacterium]